MGGQLVVVVTKAQDLPNRRKLDKQSPYCVARIQDQVQKTKVIPRGGQNPQWDDEMRFSLDNVSGNTISFFIYHQLKKEDGLVCKAEIDFTSALSKSSKEGFDSWYELEYENRPAGRIYLEITYYPTSGPVPLQIPSLMKMSMSKTQHYSSLLNGGDDEDDASDSDDDNDSDVDLGYGLDKPDRRANGNKNFKSSLMSRLNVELPPLPDINSPRTHKSQKEHTAVPAGDVGDKGNGWMSKILETAYTSFFNKPAEIDTSNLLSNGISRKKISRSTFFNDDSSDEEAEEEEEEEEEERQQRQKKTAASPRNQRRVISEQTSFEDEDDDEETFQVGQRVAFRSSVNSSNRVAFPSQNHNNLYNDSDSESEDEMESLRESFHAKPLPSKPVSSDVKTRRRPPVSEETHTDIPAPPAHQIPLTRSTFAAETEKVIRSRANKETSGLSYSQIRKLNQAKSLANSPIRLR